MCVLSLALGLGTAAAITEGVMAAVGIAGASVGIAGTIAGAEQSQAALDFEAEQAEANRKLYEKYASDIEEQGAWEKRNLALKQRSALASQQASAAASGVLLNHGSNLTMQEDAAQTNLIDQKQLAYDIDSRAYQARLGAWQAQNQLNSLEAQRSNLKSSTTLGVVGGIASGLGSTLSMAASGAALGSKFGGGDAGGLSSLKTTPTLTQKTGFGAGAGAFEPWYSLF